MAPCDKADMYDQLCQHLAWSNFTFSNVLAVPSKLRTSPHSLTTVLNSLDLYYLFIMWMFRVFVFFHTYPWLLLFQICASYRSCSILFLIRVTSPTHQFVCSFFVYIYTSVLYTSSRALINIQTSVLFPCISLYKLSSVSDPYISARAIPFHTHTLEWSHSIHIRSSDPVPYTSTRVIPFHTHPLEWYRSIHIRSSDHVPYTSAQVIPFHTYIRPTLPFPCIHIRVFLFYM